MSAMLSGRVGYIRYICYFPLRFNTSGAGNDVHYLHIMLLTKNVTVMTPWVTEVIGPRHYDLRACSYERMTGHNRTRPQRIAATDHRRDRCHINWIESWSVIAPGTPCRP